MPGRPPGDFGPALAILIVDDNRALADSLVQVFRSTGHDAQAAYTLSEARAIILKRDLDLILTDVCLVGPDTRDGLTLLDWITTVRPGTEVAVMSGYGDSAMERDTRRSGGVRFYHKPVESAHLLGLAQAAALRKAGKPAHPPSESESLTAAAAQVWQQEYLSGNDAALDRILAAMLPIVQSVSSGWYGLPIATAHDVYQEVCIEVMLKISRIRSLRPFVVGTAINRCRVALRAVGRAQHEDSEVEMLPASSSAETDVLTVPRLRAALAALDETDRCLIHMLFFENAPYRTIAQRLNIPTGSIGPIRVRLLAKLRLALEASGTGIR